ncbi:D-2-hydroxyacid dehydrogenase [Streptomyces montanisoli]|uniref:D-2-hydroxyacid dehydrogenase n=1 Tax=Streptomyces montanisoli TaxID=2798581 RepID=A0A940MGQ7_9ACTN|nr:D-2-hydroxyacid dehydrogenase [Streptomyces montanisoli]MBP0458313.1 D-2-hydroxyacid dehydrogenase [Streptomyces montanisoli]
MPTTGLPVVAVLAEREPPVVERLAGAARVLRVGERDLAGALAEADVLLVWDFLTSALPEAWPERGGPRWVHTASAGVDRLLFSPLRESDTLVTNSRGVFERPIAEYVAGLVLAMAKDLPGTLERQRSREWRHRVTESVAGTRAVVVGGGPVGRAVARLLGALGLRADLVSRTARDGDPEFGRVHGFGDLAGLLPAADWVVCAAPLTEQTADMFDAAAFARMKRGARFVNVGRGPLVVEDDLLDALRTGTLGGAALDVFRQEPLPADSPLWDAPGLLVSPHMSGDTRSWLDDLADVFLGNFERWVAGRPLLNIVDKELGYVPVAGRPGAAPRTEEGTP